MSLRIAVGNEALWDPMALEALHRLRDEGHQLHYMSESLIPKLPSPFTKVTVAPVGQWAVYSTADLFIGSELEAARAFVQHGRKAVYLGIGETAHIGGMAVVPTWPDVVIAVEFWRRFLSGPKIQVEWPNSVPGFSPA